MDLLIDEKKINLQRVLKVSMAASINPCSCRSVDLGQIPRTPPTSLTDHEVHCDFISREDEMIRSQLSKNSLSIHFFL